MDNEEAPKAYVWLRTKDGTPGTSRVYVVVDGKEYEVENVAGVNWSIGFDNPANIGKATIEFLIWSGYIEEEKRES